MGKISAGLFITLDNVVEAPGSGDTTLEGKRGWSEPYMAPEIGMAIMQQMDSTDGMLLGRVTYEAFAAFWSSAPDSDPFGQRMNAMRKYVVSSTLDKADWNNTSVLKGMEDVAKLRDDGKNLNVVGSGTLVQSLLDADLLDELQLLLCPVVLGVGKRLYKDGSSKSMQLISAAPFSTGMVSVVYQPKA
jgi:dihydrofolate reductase